MNSDQLLWQAESDAETMARYEEIMGDASRRNAAIRAAKSKATDLTRRASAMSKVAGSSASSKPRRKK